MLKKILIFIVLLVSLSSVNVFWACEYSWDPNSSLESCLWDSKVVKVENAEVWTWFKDKINEWITKIATALSVLAVGWIVYGSLLMVVSAWEDEKVKKWKEIIKWSTVGILWVVLASSIIAIIINLMYSI
jgi:hypothetical protein